VRDEFVQLGQGCASSTSAARGSHSSTTVRIAPRSRRWRCKRRVGQAELGQLDAIAERAEHDREHAVGDLVDGVLLD
jgi:hypothetical protein